MDSIDFKLPLILMAISLVVYIYMQNSQAVKKKVWPMKKKERKSCEIQGGGPEVAVMVG